MQTPPPPRTQKCPHLVTSDKKHAPWPLVLVTVSKDNPSELYKTCKSVALQTKKPDRYLVVDSSSDSLIPRMREIAEEFGASYEWIAPRGVYPAMTHALESIGQESYVWFINSSDWLAGSESIRVVSEVIDTASRESAPPAWIIGQLALEKPKGLKHHVLPTRDQDFLPLLSSGLIGFPHPSAIISRQALTDVGAFQDGLLIAADYSTALRVGKKYGTPLLVPNTLSVHVPTGFTSQNKLRHAFEKSLARTRVNGSAFWALEPFRQVVRFVRNKFPSQTPAWNTSRQHENGYPIWLNNKFADYELLEQIKD